MARPWFKAWWTRIVPVPVERSTYVLLSSLALMLLFWQWRPMGGEVWSVTDPIGRAVLYALFAFGWLLVLVATFLINHFDLFGLRQVWLHFVGQPYTALHFATPGPYRLVRHPLYVGWFFAFWMTPTMTPGTPGVRRRYDRLHPGRHPARGTRSRLLPRTGLRGLPAARADDRAAAAARCHYIARGGTGTLSRNGRARSSRLSCE